jgi:hypothetical protein
MPALSAVAKPFFPELDSQLLSLTEKFCFLEEIQIRAMQSKNSASLLTQLQMSFNLLFKEQKLYLSASVMSNSSVTECIFSPSDTSHNTKPAETINSLSQKSLTPRKLKKQERGAKWKLNKLSGNSIKPQTQAQTAPTNSDLVSKISSKSNTDSDIVYKQNKNSLQSSHSKLLSTTKSTVEVPSMSSSVAISIPTTSDDNFDSKQTVNSLQDLLKENTQSVSNVAPVISTVKIQSVSNVTPIPLHRQEGEYTGDLTVKGIRHGRGNMKYTVEPYLDHLYEGTWKFDKFYGNGKYTCSNGSIIEGK